MRHEMNGILMLDANNMELVASGVGKLKLITDTLTKRWIRRLAEPVPRLFMIKDVERPLT